MPQNIMFDKRVVRGKPKADQPSRIILNRRSLSLNFSSVKAKGLTVTLLDISVQVIKFSQTTKVEANQIYNIEYSNG